MLRFKDLNKLILTHNSYSTICVFVLHERYLKSCMGWGGVGWRGGTNIGKIPVKKNKQLHQINTVHLGQTFLLVLENNHN